MYLLQTFGYLRGKIKTTREAMFIEFITPLVLMGVSPLKNHVLLFSGASSLSRAPPK